MLMYGFLIYFFIQSFYETEEPIWATIHIYSYFLDVRLIPGTILHNDFYHVWHENLVQIVKNIGYWRYYAASLIPFILYLICLPIISLG